ncbi:MAG: SGNH/GDSL hydrolase family protein [Chitinophagaceae bacterium]|nr:MAG: SGNH/GDSL hydrolase family protein [Chitinophagaceae bacterium]
MTKHPEDKKPLTYLALGDSYTIGESVPGIENYPSRTVALLESEAVHFSTPEIIAQTGWTTTDLRTAIGKSQLAGKYDFVTLLIGVNNQYQNLEIADFAQDFETLLEKAISLAGNDTGHVVVLSIPDWSVTPYATNHLPDRFGRNAASVSKQIDEYNAACRLISGKYHITFIDITDGTRAAAKDPSLLTSDGLHPSGKEYALWAEKLASIIKKKFR